MGASVTILDIDVSKLRQLSEISNGILTTLVANEGSIEDTVANADLVVGAVLIPGATAPKVVTRNMISRMRQGSVIVDVAIDQGGCIETSHPTDFDHPVFTVDGVIHCCIANMPAAVARTSTLALTNATFPYVRQLANLGFEETMVSNRPLVKGVNLFKGNLTCKAVADSLNLEYTPIEALGIGQRNRRQK
jgi:alanine dehydrogenase